jgi:sec-independent protein translocase protein TatC
MIGYLAYLATAWPSFSLTAPAHIAPMPRPPANQDLFQQSTMTFGEHLEELRTCLFKSLFGLILGCIVGLLIGGSVVRYMETPLGKALESFYGAQSLRRAEVKVEALRARGVTVPQDSAELKHLVQDEQLLPEELFINPADILEQLKTKYPQQFPTLPALPAKPKEKLERSDLVRLFFWRPIEDDSRVRVKSLSAQEPFSIYLKASVLVGAVLASPWIFYQLWMFVGAGLYPHEKKYVHIFLPFSVLLFLAGAALAFFFVFKPVLAFLFYFNTAMGIEPDPRISEWMGFVLMLPLGFGLAFQLPLVMLFVERIGVLTIKTYWSFWRVAVLAIAVLAMLLTPEPTSMMMMVVPLTLLYFGGIALCKYLPRSRKPYESWDG